MSVRVAEEDSVWENDTGASAGAEATYRMGEKEHVFVAFLNTQRTFGVATLARKRRVFEDEIELPVQVNGKLRGKLKVAAGTGQEELLKLALAEHVISQHLDGKRIVKVVYVSDKLLNLVVA